LLVTPTGYGTGYGTPEARERSSAAGLDHPRIKRIDPRALRDLTGPTPAPETPGELKRAGTGIAVTLPNRAIAE
jgi:hypothetical protein